MTQAERTCRFCGCVDERACVVDDMHGVGAKSCMWIAADVCSNPVCAAALNEDLAARLTELKVDGHKVAIEPDVAQAIIRLTARVVGGHARVDVR